MPADHPSVVASLAAPWYGGGAGSNPRLRAQDAGVQGVLVAKGKGKGKPSKGGAAERRPNAGAAIAARHGRSAAEYRSGLVANVQGWHWIGSA